MADYGNLFGVAMPGTLGDTSTYNIDGACFVSDDSDSILCGKIVTVKSVYDGQYKEISDKFKAGVSLPYGVVLRSHVETFKDNGGYIAYQSGDAINVISHGRAWVLSEDFDEQPEFGNPVSHSLDGFASKTGQEIAGWIYTGGWRKWDSRFYIVEIQMIQNSPHVEASERVLVNGAVLNPSLPSPQAPNKVIIISVSVSPSDADDKTGNWSVDNDQCIITPRDDSSAMLTTKNSGSNDVHVTWEANDGSGVRAMIPYTFIDSVGV